MFLSRHIVGWKLKIHALLENRPLITLIPFKNNEIAQQFTYADEFIFLDERGNIEAEISNPCTDGLAPGYEQKLAELIGAFQACRVLVKEISLSAALLLEENGAIICQLDSRVRFLHDLTNIKHSA